MFNYRLYITPATGSWGKIFIDMHLYSIFYDNKPWPMSQLWDETDGLPRLWVTLKPLPPCVSTLVSFVEKYVPTSGLHLQINNQKIKYCVQAIIVCLFQLFPHRQWPWKSIFDDDWRKWHTVAWPITRIKTFYHHFCFLNFRNYLFKAIFTPSYSKT